LWGGGGGGVDFNNLHPPLLLPRPGIDLELYNKYPSE
jgi:hypothetical protein